MLQGMRQSVTVGIKTVEINTFVPTHNISVDFGWDSTILCHYSLYLYFIACLGINLLT